MTAHSDPSVPRDVAKALSDICRALCGRWAAQGRHDDACVAVTAHITMRATHDLAQQ